MAPQAGPSRPHKGPKKSGKSKPSVRSSKVKKVSEKQQIEALERAVEQFVCLSPP